MTELFEQAIRAAGSLAPATQDEIARLVLAIAGEQEAALQLTPEQEASLGESLAQATRREFATEEQVRAAWAKHGL